MKKNIFSNTDKKIISALYQLDRFATANEVSDWAEVSWNTAKAALASLYGRGIIERKTTKGKKYYKIKEFE